MSKYKCEYFSKVTGEKEFAMMADRSDFLEIIETNKIDCDKEIKIFEKDVDWKLAYHVIDGKAVLKNFSVGMGKVAQIQEQSLQRQNSIDKVIDFMTKEVCPTRKANQTMFDIIFDGLICDEDVSKPKLKIEK